MVDALTKEMRQDFTADALAKVETRTKFSYVTQSQQMAIENGSKTIPPPLADIEKTVEVKSNFLVIRVFEDEEVDDFVAPPSRLG